MLMLVVTIIIAAVVSGFAGGLVGNTGKKAPTLTMDVKVVNMGSYTGSGFYATVTSVSEPIPTKNLKIVTSWTAANGTMPVSGGNTTLPGIRNVGYLFNPDDSLPTGLHVAPFGTGPGINGTLTVGGVDTWTNLSAPGQQFGNYSLMTGTTFFAMPCGANSSESMEQNATSGYGVLGRFHYSDASGRSVTSAAYPDAATAVLGSNWELLRLGDLVNVRMIYVPTGTVIFDKDIAVTEA